MSAKRGLVALGLTLGLGATVGYASHEVSNLRVKAAREAACLDGLKSRDRDNLIDYCYEHPVSDQEVHSLRDTANTLGNLGWVAFGGALIAGVETIALVDHPPTETDTSEKDD